jgi:excisionase family DNA binding protein
MGTDPLLLTVPQAAARLGCGRTFLYELIARGEIPSVHLGRTTRVPSVALHEYVLRLAQRAAIRRQLIQRSRWRPARRVRR